MGAALAVCGGPSRQLPLSLAASKSWVGHAEPAAGLAGLLFAQHLALQRHGLPLLHLRAVNPYVASALEQGSAVAGAAAHLPRQAGPQPDLGGHHHSRTVAVSAFAFQGTNAHALVEALGSEAAPAAAPASWQRRWHYVLPAAHLLAASVRVTAQPQRSVHFAAPLNRPQLAYLWDHRVMGKAIFPGAQHPGCPAACGE